MAGEGVANGDSSPAEKEVKKNKNKKSGGSVSFTFVAVEGGTNELLLENDLPSSCTVDMEVMFIPDY